MYKAFKNILKMTMGVVIYFSEIFHGGIVSNIVFNKNSYTSKCGALTLSGQGIGLATRKVGVWIPGGTYPYLQRVAGHVIFCH